MLAVDLLVQFWPRIPLMFATLCLLAFKLNSDSWGCSAKSFERDSLLGSGVCGHDLDSNALGSP